MAQQQQPTRSLSRLSEIAQVMVRHGFGYFFEAHKLTDLVPGRTAAVTPEETSQRGRHLREVLDELGPTFVTFGQLLSTRPDIVPPQLRGRPDREGAEGLLDVHTRARADARVARGDAARRRRSAAADDRRAPRPRLPRNRGVDGDDLPPRLLPRRPAPREHPRAGGGGDDR